MGKQRILNAELIPIEPKLNTSVNKWSSINKLLGQREIRNLYKNSRLV